MAKITIPPITSQFTSQAALNSRFQQVVDEFQNKVLYRNNPSGEPNAMANNLDMNNYRILNVGDAVNSGDAVNYGQFQTIISDINASEAAAAASAAAAAASAVAADNSADAAASDAATINVQITAAQGYAADALAYANAADASADLAQKWASEAEDVVVAGGLYSAYHYAQKAAAVVSGTREYISLYNASGGTLPIASPTTGDEGKYWVISVGGTLPGVGAVSVNDELIINSSLTYEKFTPSTAYASASHTHAASDIVSGTIDTARLPSASTSESGIVQLNNTTTSTSTTQAATAGVLKTTYDLANQTASTTVAGRVELATTAETTTGTDTTRATTPAGVAAAIAALATGDDLGTMTQIWSGNATSVTLGSYPGNGLYVIEFAGAFVRSFIYLTSSATETRKFDRAQVESGTAYIYSILFADSLSNTFTTKKTNLSTGVHTSGDAFFQAIYKVG